jgi:hypothetical protein
MQEHHGGVKIRDQWERLKAGVVQSDPELMKGKIDQVNIEKAYDAGKDQRRRMRQKHPDINKEMKDIRSQIRRLKENTILKRIENHNKSKAHANADLTETM